jgi:integrase
MKFNQVKLYKPPGGNTYCFKIPSHLKPKKRHFNTRQTNKDEAEKVRDDYLTQMESRANNQVFTEATLDKAIDAYLTARGSLAKKSLIKYKAAVLEFKLFIVQRLGVMPRLQDIDKPLIESYLQWLIDPKPVGKQSNPHTRNDKRNILTNFFIYTVDNGWLEKNPVAKIKKIDEPDSVHPEPLNSGEVGRLLNQLKLMKKDSERVVDQCCYEITAIAYYAGARVSEALHLFKTDIIFSERRIFLHNKIIDGIQYYTKTRKDRYVPIVPELEAILRAWVKEVKNNPSPLLFPSADGSSIHYDRCYETAIEAMRRAGLPPKEPFHRGRHTFTSLSIKEGVSEALVQGALGHKTPIMTRHYTHLDPIHIAKQFSSLSYGQNKKGKT